MLKRQNGFQYKKTPFDEFYCNIVERDVENKFIVSVPSEYLTFFFDLDDKHLNLPDMTVEELRLIIPMISETLYSRGMDKFLYDTRYIKNIYHLSFQKRIPLVLMKMLECNRILSGYLYKESKLELIQLTKRTYEDLYHQVGEDILKQYKWKILQAGVLPGIKLQWLEHLNAEEIMETAIVYQQYQDKWRSKIQVYIDEYQSEFIEIDDNVIDLLQVRFFDYIYGGKNHSEYGETNKVEYNNCKEARQQLETLLSNAKKSEHSYFVTVKELDTIRKLTQEIYLTEEENGLKLKSIIDTFSYVQLNEKILQDIKGAKLCYEIPEVGTKIQLKRYGYEEYSLIAYEMQQEEMQVEVHMDSCNDAYIPHFKLQDLWEHCPSKRTVIRVKNVENGNEYVCNLPHITRICKNAFVKVPILEFVLSKPLHTMEEYVFEQCKYLRRVAFDSYIKEIKSSIFYQCNELKEVRLSDEWEVIQKAAFSGCSKLETIELPKQLQEIKTSAFRGCMRLKKLIFPETLKRIEENAFYMCHNLEEVVFPEGLESIGANAFEGCYQLKKIVFPSTLKVVESEAFRSCTELSHIEFQCPNVWLKTGVFENCIGLQHLDLSKTNILMFHRLFFDCKNLKTIILPVNTNWIGSYAFGNCHSLKTVVFPRGEYGEGKQKEWYWRKFVEEYEIDLELKDVKLSEVDIYYKRYTNDDGSWGESVIIGGFGEWISWGDKFPLKRIEDGAFSNCLELEEIQIPDDMERLDFKAFAGCVKLKNISLPSSKEKSLFIDIKVFEDCEQLENIVIPKNKKKSENKKKIRHYERENKPLTYRPFENLSNMITFFETKQ